MRPQAGSVRADLHVLSCYPAHQDASAPCDRGPEGLTLVGGGGAGVSFGDQQPHFSGREIQTCASAIAAAGQDAAPDPAPGTGVEHLRPIELDAAATMGLHRTPALARAFPLNQDNIARPASARRMAGQLQNL